MRALAIVHQRDAGPGVFAEAIAAAGVELDEWLLPEGSDAPREPASYDAVLTFGGGMHADQEAIHPWLASEKALLRDLLESGTPLLGVCLGSQLLAEAAGGAARRAPRPEIGWVGVDVTSAGAQDPVIGPLAPRFGAFAWHSYEVDLPPGAVELARSDACLHAYRIGEAAWGIQFHAEVSATNAAHWIDDYRTDPDAVRIGLDTPALRTETEGKIGAWNQLGRDLCGRFLEAIQARVA